MEIIRKVMNALSTLLVTVVVSLAVLLVGVRLVGLTPYAVLSGSMEPTYHVGALIYVKDIEPQDIVIGTPITFVVNEDLLLATHRVVGVDKRTTRQEQMLDEQGQPLLDENGHPMTREVPLDEPTYYYQTKGDANETVDGSPVHHKNVVGTPVFSIPYLGYLSSWLQTPRGMILGGSVALVLLILTFIPDLLAMADDSPPGAKPEKKKNKPRKKPAQKARTDAKAAPRPARPAPRPAQAAAPPQSAAPAAPVMQADQTAAQSPAPARRRAQAAAQSLPPQTGQTAPAQAPRRRRRQLPPQDEA